MPPSPQHPPPAETPASTLGTGSAASGFGPLFVADWRRVVFVHFAVKPADLAAHVPHPLDIVDGRAFVSLVSFSLERLRPGRLIPPRFGRAMLGPISQHAFLNVRTYVRGPAGAGIHFLAEWINNPISVHLGPLTYGLPYRFANIQRADLPAGGLTQIRVSDPDRGCGLGITVPFDPSIAVGPSEPGTLDEFLVERYTAYTHRHGVNRFFHIAHNPWDIARVDLVRTDTTLLEQLYPWFRHAELVSAHVGPGVQDVVIGRPHRCSEARLRAGAGASTELPGASISWSAK
jgi:uncharacterized protein YqjF (DUF2071 family)